MSASYGLSPGLIATPERSSNLFPELASAELVVEEGAILLSLTDWDPPTCRLGWFDSPPLSGFGALKAEKHFETAALNER